MDENEDENEISIYMFSTYEPEHRRRLHLFSNTNEGNDQRYSQISSKVQKKLKDDNNATSKFLLCKRKIIKYYEEKRFELHVPHVPRKIVFIVFISLCTFELMTSQTFNYSSHHDKNPYHGLSPIFDKAQTNIKSHEEQHNVVLENEESFIPLPPAFMNIADVATHPVKKNDVPFYFHIPRSGGSTIKDIMGSCLGLVGASDVGVRNEYKSSPNKIEIVTTKEGSRFVNVDTTTLEGIKHAKELGLVESNLADYVVTQYVHSAAELFTNDNQGR